MSDLSKAVMLLSALAVPTRLELLAEVTRRQDSGRDCSMTAIAVEE